METVRHRPHWKPALLTALTLVLLGTAATPAAADDDEDVENFSFSSWDLSYELEIVDEVAVAHVTEELTAQFPDYDQNRGLVRAVPLHYEGAPTDIEDISVTDAEGAELPFDTDTEDGMRLILTGDDEYVHGEQTYRIGYTVHNVLDSPSDADIDEFYWDLVPSARPQAIEAVTAEITLSSELAEAFNGNASCYMGTEDSQEPCDITSEGAGSATVTVPSVSLSGNEGLTIGVGFEAGTVPQPAEREDNWVLDILPIALGAASTGLGVAGLIVMIMLRSRRSKDTGNTLPRYGVPDDVPMLIAAPVASATGSAVTAEILRLAVRGVLRIEDTGESGGVFSKTPTPVLHLVDPAGAADPLEQRLLTGLFPSLQPGDTFTLPTKGKEKQTFATSMQKLTSDGPKEAQSRGLLTKERSTAGMLLGMLGIVLLVPLVVLIVLGASRDNSATIAIAAATGAIGLVAAFITFFPQRVHTPEGANLYQQLQAVRVTIRKPEENQHTMLQTEQNTGGRSTGVNQVVELHDKVLPFAVIFGLEKQWSKVLESTYQDYGILHPVWYPALFQQGSGSLQNTLSGFTSAMTSSSGTSGSTGGGSVGGGGGGGAAGGR